MHLAINGWFLDQPASGSGQYTMRLLEQLDKLWKGRMTVIIPSPAHRGPGKPRPSAGNRASAVPEWSSRTTAHSVNLPSRGPVAKLWFEQIAVPRAAAQADLLHVPYLGAPVTCPVPVVVTVHDLLQLVVPRLRGGVLNRLYNLIAAVGARRAAMVLADSDYSRETVLGRLGLPPERARRVYLAVDTRFTPTAAEGEEAALRSHFGLHGSFILYAGGLDWRKNVPLLIRAYARSSVSWPLAIAGEARSRRSSSFPDLAAEIRDAGVTDRVRLLGWVEEELKPALYRAAALFVFPSRYEGFGLPPLEALASGTPTCCSNATSLPEVVADAALLFDPDDEAGLAALLRRAVDNPDLRTRLRRAGPERARRFSWETAARQTIDVYQQALDRRP